MTSPFLRSERFLKVWKVSLTTYMYWKNRQFIIFFKKTCFSALASIKLNMGLMGLIEKVGFGM